MVYNYFEVLRAICADAAEGLMQMLLHRFTNKIYAERFS